MFVTIHIISFINDMLFFVPYQFFVVDSCTWDIVSKHWCNSMTLSVVSGIESGSDMNASNVSKP